ncbi:MAG: tyrosine-type recombinase/integrase [Candidatus Kapabacteria bacterium]|nr:tyrosine-type recombinase/integrase [Candidatus Kapabacteria bacterium]
MPRPKQPINKWYSKKYAKGYVENRNGLAHARHGDNRKALKLRFTPENERAAVKLLDEWLDLKLNNPDEYKRQRLKAHRNEEQISTVYELYAEYKRARMADKSKLAHNRMNTAVRFWFPEDCLLEYDTLYPAMLRRVSDHTLGPAYYAKMLQAAGRLMEYGVARGCVSRNPCALFERPKIVTHEPEIFTDDEVRRIMEYFNEPVPSHYTDHENTTKRKRQWGRAVKLLHLTGMRVNEALKLKKSDVHPNHFLIHGKGDYYREFPTKHFPEVRELLREAMDFATGDRIFNISSDKLRKWFNDACDMKNVPREVKGRKRTLHKLRATAEHHFEHELQLPAHVVADIAGHSLTTYKKHYRTRMRATTLDKFIEEKVGAGKG